MRASARAVVPALVVVALLCVVALAATGSTSRGDDRVRPPSATLLDTILTLALLGILAGGVLVAYGLTQRRAIAREIATKKYPRSSVVGWLVFVGLFMLVVYWRLGLWEYRPPLDPAVSEILPTDSTPLPSESDPDANAIPYEPGIAWAVVAVVLFLVAAAVVAYVVAERRGRSRTSERDVLAEEVAAVLDDTLEDLRAEPDPRRAIIAAYARLERVLAANGLPRHSSETEEELLGRLLTALDVSAPAARRLTDLFERAKFSPHAVDVGMKEEAIAALELLRDELRRSKEERDELAGAATAPGEAAA